MKQKVKRLSHRPVRSSDVPVTLALLHKSEDRLSARMDKGFHALKSEIHGVKSEVEGMKSDMHGLKAEIHRIGLLVEEQNARNKFVLEGYAQLHESQSQLRQEFSQMSEKFNQFQDVVIREIRSLQKSI